MRRTTLHMAALALALLILSPGRSYAHPPDNSFRLGLGIPAFLVDHYPDPDVTFLRYGLTPATFGFQIGGQFASSFGFVVHALAGGSHVWTPAGDADFVILAVAPRFEYMFTPHGTVAPYLGVESGIEASGDPDRDLNVFFRVGGLFGLHIFADTHFSFDIEFGGDFIYDFQSENGGVRGLVYISVTGWI